MLRHQTLIIPCSKVSDSAPLRKRLIRPLEFWQALSVLISTMTGDWKDVVTRAGCSQKGLAVTWQSLYGQWRLCGDTADSLRPPERLVPVELLFHYSVEERGVDPPALIILRAFIFTVIKDLSTEAVQQEHEVTARTWRENKNMLNELLLNLFNSLGSNLTVCYCFNRKR